MSTTYENGVYSFQDVHCSIIGPNINMSVTGAAEEGFTIEFDGDKDTLTMGADGSGMHSLHAAQNGTITLRLLKTGVLNQGLSNAYNFQTGSAANHGRNTIEIRDPVRGDIITAVGGAFRKFPNITYAREGGTQEWAFNCTRVMPNLGAGVGSLITV